MKTKKNLIGIMLSVCCLCLLNVLPVSAHEIDKTNQKDESNIVTLNGIPNPGLNAALRYIPCSGGGQHTMYGRGGCSGYRGSANGPNKFLFKGGEVTQCSKCLMVLATQYNPYWHPTSLGWYTTVGSFNTNVGTGYHYIYSDYWTYNESWASDPFFRSFSFYS